MSSVLRRALSKSINLFSQLPSSRFWLLLSRGSRVGQQSAVSRTTESRGDPSRDRHSHSVPDTAPWNADLPRYRAGHHPLRIRNAGIRRRIQSRTSSSRAEGSTAPMLSCSCSAFRAATITQLTAGRPAPTTVPHGRVTLCEQPLVLACPRRGRHILVNRHERTCLREPCARRSGLARLYLPVRKPPASGLQTRIPML